MACGIITVIPGIEAGPSAVKEWSPNHWTTREFPLNIPFICTETPEKSIHLPMQGTRFNSWSWKISHGLGQKSHMPQLLCPKACAAQEKRSHHNKKPRHQN